MLTTLFNAQFRNKHSYNLNILICYFSFQKSTKMSSTESHFELPGLQELGAYSVKYTDQDILVNGPDVITCQEIARHIHSGHKKVVIHDNKQFLMNTIDESNSLSEPAIADNPPDTEVDHAPPSISKERNATVKKTKKKAGNKQEKVKTENSNSWIQFCRIKKNKAILETGDTDATYDLKDAQDEWKDKSKEEKAFYVELAQVEKNALGDKYRAGREWKKEKSVTKLPKLSIKKGKTKEKQVKEVAAKAKVDTGSAGLEFLEHLEDIDEEIEKQEEENIRLAGELERGKVLLAVSQCKLENKKSELNKTSEKLDLLVKQHACCSPE
jgi:hypothetical protein